MEINEILLERALGLFCCLIEKRIFHIKNIKLENVAVLCNCTPLILEQAIYEKLGYSFDQMITHLRVGYARELLLIGIEYRFVYKYSGFNSSKELEMALGCIAN